MISIPVSDTSHARLTRAARWLCILGYVGLAIGFAWTALSGHRQAQAILKDPVSVQVPVQLDHIEESRRKGRVSHTYQFRYQFVVDGVARHGEFSTSEDNATPYLEDGAQVEVAYARADPARFERMDRLQGQKDLGAVLGRLSVGVVLLGVLAFVVFLLLTRKLFVVRQPHAASAA
ncbi:DUF3592 domain-containing protein [Stenotrophomonas sp. BIGb0135]|jgi:hypothetical protein|uniref:DUF3592 domain-containing protein n=1 Tax=Stenotrophomonas sp. BIGb0135 TaxID=2940620 RepID=UPI00216A5D70|nr:DUF3592 domain-containing protein [Stenotrophomonas sp. BIGb0135]MCS4236047.1 hypothetical protein [Stenotrophomonas sp. BIGb0135]